MGTGMRMVDGGNSRGTVVWLLNLWMLSAGAGFWVVGSAGAAALAQTVVVRQPVFIQDQVSGRIEWIERRPVLQPENQVGLLAAEKLLATTELAKELELSQRQQQELAAWLKKAERESARLFFEAYKGDRDPAEVEELGQLLRANLGEDLQEILLPPQRRRLAEVEQRIALRLMGWEKYWQTFVRLQALTLSADEQLALREQQEQWAAESPPELRKLRDALQEAICQPLTAEQRERLQERRTQLRLDHQDLDLELAQIQMALDSPIRTGRSDGRFAETQRGIPTYQLLPDGRFVGTRTDGQSYVTHWVLHVQPLELSPEQSAAIELLREEHQAFQAEMLERLRDLADPLTDSERFRQTTAARLQDEHRRCERAVRQILTGPQWVELTGHLHDEWLPRFGWVAALLDGDLGRELNLTPAQVDQIRSAAQRARESVQRRLAEWEERYLASFRGCLAEEHRQQLELALGRPLVYVHPLARVFEVDPGPDRADRSAETARGAASIKQ